MIVLYELFVLYYSFISPVHFLYCHTERCGVSSMVLDGLMPGTFVSCFGASCELDLVLEGMSLVVLDLALGREGNWVVGMDWAAWGVSYCWWGCLEMCVTILR